ncbi:hypothetical protein JCGZ_17226 [Jatropha curcas]|uniref:DNA-directed RNA polymerase III subunit RPC9 n=1 Tax=Jatropha curcas TaxID=180498 RepID=A0A067LMI0_JATCU|nr:DNA-directed RNA polymerase III subunit RPC9 [Jatropha curcas]XP_020536680.1 DNA-directed RNA polymerase III subunit RPC9 [Jatropha curcas]XP_020536682.1 DNA-directed RNA polymerase III subunit RPC9 [Jatropha curcas]XP_037493956.1 DNA-directed RNA polymerase III subunit RPC9 [Jatropha curcas]KDP45619.1 hypothetical protein JCGZ_17226 [Jatropha curcas]
MHIIKANAGALTNFEVLEFLKARGASKDSSRVIAPVSQSEYKVYDYLVETPACWQSREQITEFFEKCEPYRLAKAEILNIINIVPYELVELEPLIEQPDQRLGDRVEELLDLVTTVFPRPEKPTPEDGIDEDKEETGNEEQNEDKNETSVETQIDEEGKENENADQEPMEIS